MKIRLNFEKTNLIRLIVAMIFAAVLYFKVTFPVYVLAGFGVSYFLIKSLSGRPYFSPSPWQSARAAAV